MDRSRKFSFLIIALAMAGVFTVACDSGTQEPAAPAGSKPLTSSKAADSQSSSRLSPSALAKGVVAAIPDGFPAEVPIYPGSVPSMGKSGVSDGIPMAAVQLLTTDSPEQVYDFYMEKFSSEGWTIEEQHAGLRGKNAVTATNGKCKATMLAAPDENGTLVFLITEC